jgi:beta-lactam-binding protein with PASTA domain
MYQFSGTVPKGDVMSLTPDVGSKAPCGSTIALVISEGKDLQAVLNIESIPTSADVFINGEARGKTPLKLYLPLEKYEVRVSMQGYYEYEAQIKLDKEGEIPVLARLISKD